jgi:hypothetical protein
MLPSSPRFQAITQLSQEGYGDSARKVIGAQLARMATTDSNYAEALFTASVVAGTGDDAGRYLKRIVVEFPTSAWGDKAQLRLAQLAYGNADMDEVMTRVGRIFADYPHSSVLPNAALWGARAAFDRQKLQQGCDWLTRGLAAVGDEVELRNQLQYAKQRCNLGPGLQLAPFTPDSLRAGPPPAIKPVDSATPPPPPPIAPPVRGAARSPWRVQVIAIADRATVRRIVAKLEAAGYTAYQVPGPRGLIKVQAGPFATRAAAAARLAKVRAVTGGSPFVTAAP